MNRNGLRQTAVVATFLVTLIVNGVAGSVGIGGRMTGEISDLFQNFFTPAGYVFSIWGVIYLGLAAFTVYQALPGQRQNPRLQRIGWLFVLTNLLNAAWIFAWHYLLIPLSWLIMIALLITLLLIYVRLGIGTHRTSVPEVWTVNVPFSIYAAWISVATIANTTVLLQDLGFDGGPIAEPVWSAIVLVVGAAIGSYVVYTRRDVAFAAVIVWAYAGIVVKYVGTDVVTITAGLMAVAVLMVLAGSFLRSQPPGRHLQGTAA